MENYSGFVVVYFWEIRQTVDRNKLQKYILLLPVFMQFE